VNKLLNNFKTLSWSFVGYVRGIKGTIVIGHRFGKKSKMDKV
jgi:hypothetical protein